MRVRERVRGVVAVATVAVAAALLAGAAPGVAGAGVVGTIPVDPTVETGGVIDKAGTRTWRAYLERGRYYALGGTTISYVDVAVRRPDGRVLAAAWLSEDDYDGDGAVFRAPVTGWYAVAVTLPLSCPYGTPCPPAGYELTLGRDCPAGPATPCTIAVGQTLHRLWSPFDGDVDWFRVGLRAGVPYRIALPKASEAGEVDAYLVDAGGRRIGGPARNFGEPATVSVPTAGTYYVAVSNLDGGQGFYDLSLAPAP